MNSLNEKQTRNVDRLKKIRTLLQKSQEQEALNLINKTLEEDF